MLCAIGASFVFQVLTRPMVGYNWVVSGMVVGVLDSVLDPNSFYYEFYFTLRTTRTTSVFLYRFGKLLFAERGAKRKKGKLNYPVRDRNRKIIQQARDNLPKDRLLRITAGGCLCGIGCHGI